MEERFGNPDNRQTLAEELRSQLAEGVDFYFASLDSTVAGSAAALAAAIGGGYVGADG